MSHYSKFATRVLRDLNEKANIAEKKEILKVCYHLAALGYSDWMHARVHRKMEKHVKAIKIEMATITLRDNMSEL